MTKPHFVVPASVAAQVQEILNSVIVRVDDVQSALVSTPDGFAVATYGVGAGSDPARIAAMASSMMAMARSVASELGHSGSRRLIFETDTGIAIFQNVPSAFPCILCLVLRKEGVLGRALWAMGEATNQLVQKVRI